MCVSDGESLDKNDDSAAITFVSDGLFGFSRSKTNPSVLTSVVSVLLCACLFLSVDKGLIVTSWNLLTEPKQTGSRVRPVFWLHPDSLTSQFLSLISLVCLSNLEPLLCSLPSNHNSSLKANCGAQISSRSASLAGAVTFTFKFPDALIGWVHLIWSLDIKQPWKQLQGLECLMRESPAESTLCHYLWSVSAAASDSERKVWSWNNPRGSLILAHKLFFFFVLAPQISTLLCLWVFLKKASHVRAPSTCGQMVVVSVPSPPASRGYLGRRLFSSRMLASSSTWGNRQMLQCVKTNACKPKVHLSRHVSTKTRRLLQDDVYIWGLYSVFCSSKLNSAASVSIIHNLSLLFAQRHVCTHEKRPRLRSAFTGWRLSRTKIEGVWKTVLLLCSEVCL